MDLEYQRSVVEGLRDRTGMYVGKRRYDLVVAFLDGGAAFNRDFLAGFDPFVKARLGHPRSNLHWAAEIAGSCVSHNWLEDFTTDEDERALEALFALLMEHLDSEIEASNQQNHQEGP